MKRPMLLSVVVLALVLVLALPVFGQDELSNYYFTDITTTGGVVTKWISRHEWARLVKPKWEHTYPEIPCGRLLKHKPKNDEISGCTVWLSCQHEDGGRSDRLKCLVPLAGFFKFCGNPKIDDPNIKMCDEKFRTPTGNPKYLGTKVVARTRVTLEGESKVAQLSWQQQTRAWRLVGIGKPINEDLIKCETLSKRHGNEKYTIRNCQAPLECQTGEGKPDQISCQIVKSGSAIKVRYCGTDKINALPLCDKDIQPWSLSYNAQITTDDGSSTHAVLQIQVGTEVSSLYPETPPESTDLLLGCSNLPTKAVEQEGDLTHCSGAIVCYVDDCMTASYHCRISDAVSSAGHLSVGACQAEPIPELKPCNLRTLQFTLDPPME